MWKSAEIDAKIKSRCFYNFPRHAGRLIKFVKARGGIYLDNMKQMFMSVWVCVITCIPCATDYF